MYYCLHTPLSFLSCTHHHANTMSGRFPRFDNTNYCMKIIYCYIIIALLWGSCTVCVIGFLKLFYGHKRSRIKVSMSLIETRIFTSWSRYSKVVQFTPNKYHYFETYLFEFALYLFGENWINLECQLHKCRICNLNCLFFII